VFSEVKPLNDNTWTPRSAKKAFMLERNWDRDRWVPNKKSLDSFDEAVKDVQRAKQFRHLSKKSARQ